MDIILPKLDFIYSYIYDSTLAELSGKEYSNKTQAEAERYIKSFSKEFSKYSKRVLKDISNISGLKWQKQLIDVYISKYAPYSLSVPLTIKIYKDVKVGTAILVHELVHNIIFSAFKPVKLWMIRIAFRIAFKDLSGQQ